MLFSKYASPFLLLDEIIVNERFCEFIVEFMHFEDEQKSWDFYLHKVLNKSFEEFKESIETQHSSDTTEDLETTIENSKKTLNNFIPTNEMERG